MSHLLSFILLILLHPTFSDGCAAMVTALGRQQATAAAPAFSPTISVNISKPPAGLACPSSAHLLLSSIDQQKSLCESPHPHPLPLPPRPQAVSCRRLNRWPRPFSAALSTIWDRIPSFLLQPLLRLPRHGFKRAAAPPGSGGCRWRRR